MSLLLGVLGALVAGSVAVGSLLVIFAPRRRQPPVPALPARNPEPAPRRVRRVIFEEITEPRT